MLRNVPEPTTVLRDLSHVIPVVNSALQFGTFKAFDYFPDFSENSDPYLASSLVRYHAKEVLKNGGPKIVEIDRSINLQNVPNIGLYLRCGQYNIRILKSKNDEIPAPGHSAKRQKFYRQIQPSECFDFYEDVDEKVNLLILWDVTPPYNLGKIALACPRDGGIMRGSVFVHWTCPIPQDILFGNIETKVNDVSNEIEDLPIFRNILIETEAEK